MVGLLLACIHHFPYAEHHGAAIALGNVIGAVACRNELFLRGVFWLVVKLFQKVSSYPDSPLSPMLHHTDIWLQWTPLWFRIFWTAFLQHIGGIHSGCATSSIAWFIYVVVRNFQTRTADHIPIVVLVWGIITVIVSLIVLIAAAPWIRHYHHKYVLIALIVRCDLTLITALSIHYQFL